VGQICPVHVLLSLITSKMGSLCKKSSTHHENVNIGFEIVSISIASGIETLPSKGTVVEIQLFVFKLNDLKVTARVSNS
jgi:hypothetical protein